MNNKSDNKIFIVWLMVILTGFACTLTSPQIITNSVDCFKGKIIFASDMDGSNEIYTMRPYCGASYERLTNNSAEDRDPHWSPDGTKIAFASDRTGQYEIYIMDEDGLNTRQLTDRVGKFATTPNWSPDGSKILFSSGTDYKYEIYTVNVSGGEQTKVIDTISAWEPSWSPDGEKIS